MVFVHVQNLNSELSRMVYTASGRMPRASLQHGLEFLQPTLKTQKAANYLVIVHM